MAELFQGYAVTASVADDRAVVDTALTQFLANVDALTKETGALPVARLTLLIGEFTDTPLTLRVALTDVPADKITAEIDAVRTWAKGASRQDKTPLVTTAVAASID